MNQLQLINLRGKLQGCDVIVCGLGTSLNELKNPEKYWTIGVNDIGAKFTPDFVLCIDPLTRFRQGTRKDDILKANPKYFVSQLAPKSYKGLVAQNYVNFKLGKRTGVGFEFKNKPERLDYHNTSPYVAVNLAAYMGAKRIFLIGVDLTPNHFNRSSGVHALAKRLKEIDNQYNKFLKECEKHGIELKNLSKISKLNSLQKVDISEVKLKEACSERDIVVPERLAQAQVRKDRRVESKPVDLSKAERKAQQQRRAQRLKKARQRADQRNKRK